MSGQKNNKICDETRVSNLLAEIKGTLEKYNNGNMGVYTETDLDHTEKRRNYDIYHNMHVLEGFLNELKNVDRITIETCSPVEELLFWLDLHSKLQTTSIPYLVIPKFIGYVLYEGEILYYLERWIDYKSKYFPEEDTENLFDKELPPVVGILVNSVGAIFCEIIWSDSTTSPFDFGLLHEDVRYLPLSIYDGIPDKSRVYVSYSELIDCVPGPKKKALC